MSVNFNNMENNFFVHNALEKNFIWVKLKENDTFLNNWVCL